MSYLSEYTKVTVNDFKGLYKRGMADQCPADHAICCENVTFHEKGQFSTRPGTGVSLALSWNVSRIFYANTAGVGHLLTLDFSGNLYADTNPTPIYSNPIMIDFCAINLFNRVYILPVTPGPSTDFLKVWDGTNPVRNAAGFAPTTGCTAATGGAGNVDPGVHQFGVCFITNTGFITHPGQEVMGVFTPTIYNAPGGASVTLSGIPIGPSYVTGRYIVVTQANELLFYFCPGGLINDNTTTTITLNFYDTDLLLSADYLFDELNEIPAATVAGALYTYHSRLFVAPGQNYCNVSDPSDPETFDAVDGLITLPNPAYNTIRGFCQLYDTLYLTKSSGINSAFDSGDVPSTWIVTEIDGAHGAFQNSIATISATTPAATENERFLLTDIGGIFTFNGAVGVLPLTWKIDDLWQTLNPAAVQNITIVQDPFRQIFYVLLPVNGSTQANLLIAGDYTEGLDPVNIKWTIYTFPFIPCSIAMLYFADADGASAAQYALRIGTTSNTFLFKMQANFTSDYGANINSYYQMYLMPMEEGMVNLYRVIRARARGTGSLTMALWKEDLQTPVGVLPIPIVMQPGKDYLREINFANEKMSITLANSSGVNDSITVDRIDVFGKRFAYARPA